MSDLRTGLLAGVAAIVTFGAAIAEDRVKVFILAGQSNMEGKVQNKLLEFQARDAKTRDLFAHLREGDDWIVRDDVFVKFLKRHGGLTIGYGSRDRTGVELEFGTVMGSRLEEPVLLVKTAWGGHSLYKSFRPPSAGLPEELLKADLERSIKKVENANKKRDRNDPLPTMEEVRKGYGSSYRQMLEEVRDTLANLGGLFPALQGKKPEIAGLVWFQGWNDQYNGAESEYESNLKHFIRDVRRDLGAPKMPVVIGVMGQNGSKPAKGAMLTIQNAQLAMEKVPEFGGNVKAVRTDVLVDQAAEKLIVGWKDHVEEWEKVGSDYGYHYLGSAIWHLRMGKAFAEAMIGMMGK